MSHRRQIITLLATAICAAGCVNDADEALPPIETAEVATTASDTTATTATTSTMEATTTSSTLSELEQTEAEIREVVTGWWQLEFDTSKGEADLRLEALTGLLRQRVDEASADFESRGIVHRSIEPGPIEIADASIDLEEGFAEVEACTALTHEFLDAETSEPLDDSDPDEPFVSEFQLQLVDEQWKISEWLPISSNNSLSECEIAT